MVVYKRSIRGYNVLLDTAYIIYETKQYVYHVNAILDINNISEEFFMRDSAEWFYLHYEPK